MEENNKGFGLAFVTIVFVAFVLPSILLLSIGDTWDRFVDKYGSSVSTECWENSKHERVSDGSRTSFCFGKNIWENILC